VNPLCYIPTKDEIISMLNERDDEVDNVQIGDAVIDRAGFKNVENELVTLKQFLKQRPTNGNTPLIYSI
jgi:hypothetical protein